MTGEFKVFIKFGICIEVAESDNEKSDNEQADNEQADNEQPDNEQPDEAR